MRKNKNAARKWHKPLTFKQICKIAGISPRQRIMLIRAFKKAGENDSNDN